MSHSGFARTAAEHGPGSPDISPQATARMLRHVLIDAHGARELAQAPAALPEAGFLWCDCPHENSAEGLASAATLAGVSIFDAHRLDAENLNHPSFFDSTAQYALIIFRSLAALPGRDDPAAGTGTASAAEIAEAADAEQGRLVPRLRTRPASFFLFPGLLLTIRAPDSRSFSTTHERLHGPRASSYRPPASPEELMLRILNTMVDRYLDMRIPLAEAFERLQRELLDPRRAFRDWYPLLEARREARRLEDLCEEQLDAIQEWRDERLETMSDALQVRTSDLVSHIERVLGHARRMEASLETAVQLHFSATAHRTNEVMRTLTAITAVFLPLTLITGVFGMNFQHLPGLQSPSGFWWTIVAMLAIAAGLLLFFRARAFIHESAFFGRRRARRRSLRKRTADLRNDP